MKISSQVPNYTVFKIKVKFQALKRHFYGINNDVLKGFVKELIMVN